MTLGWNVAGIVVLAVAAVAARSVALAGFGLDSVIEIGASVVVIWELSGTGEDRDLLPRALSCQAPGASARVRSYLLGASTIHTGPGANVMGWPDAVVKVVPASGAGRVQRAS